MVLTTGTGQWTAIDSGVASAQQHMNTDAYLLSKAADLDGPLLHHYDWKCESGTYGYFLDPYKLLDCDAVQRHNIDLARRPTGGGLLFHISDLAFSVVVPAGHPAYSTNILENYAFVNNIVIDAIRSFLGNDFAPELLPAESQPRDAACRHFCMAKPTKYDVMLDGRKVGGAAQRRTKEGFLHQGTIALGRMKRSLLDELLLPGTEVSQAMQDTTYPLLGERWTVADLADARCALRRALEQAVGIRQKFLI
ncbi:Octanoyltransferase LipM [Chlamydiales bacterium SCGC AG-110-P3]|nr:Octanoyltransferase LipM [Chlamydiales bacterium SCGC AG-110-P3]